MRFYLFSGNSVGAISETIQIECRMLQVHINAVCVNVDCFGTAHFMVYNPRTRSCVMVFKDFSDIKPGKDVCRNAVLPLLKCYNFEIKQQCNRYFRLVYCGQSIVSG